MMRWILAAGLGISLAGAPLAQAQQPGPAGHGMPPGPMMGMPPPGGPGMMMGPMRRGEASPGERPAISMILQQREALKLTAEQEQRLRALRADYEKEAARRGAEIRMAEVDLRELLNAEAPDLAKAEELVKRIAAAQGELRFARIRAIQAGLAVLTKEQRQQFERLARSAPPMMGMGMGMGPGMMGMGMGPGMMLHRH